jgi:hypothetical protein
MNIIRKPWQVPLLILACAGAAMAGSSSMQLTNAGSNVLGGVYVGPYYAIIDGVSNVAIICDDFADETFVGQTWQANVTNVAANSTTLMSTRLGLPAAQQSQMYATAAYLATQLMSGATCPPGTLNCKAANYAGDIQFAIWQLFDPADPNGMPFSYLSGYDLTNAAAWLIYALGHAPSIANDANILVYSPVGGGPPQEFLRVTTPEPAAIALLAVQLLGLTGVVVCVRRRKTRATC